MSDLFRKFVNFGLFGDASSRQKLSDEIYRQLLENAHEGIGDPEDHTDNFNAAAETILSNSTLREVCNGNPELSEKITRDILDFIQKERKQILVTPNPYQSEQDLLDEFKQTSHKNYRKIWKRINAEVKPIYSKSELDVNYFDKLLKKHAHQDVEIPGHLKYESIKEHFISLWQGLVLRKSSQWELEQIDEARKEFCEKLYKKIDNLKTLQKILVLFGGTLGRLWDMSKGNWQNVNFDLLKHYAALAEKDDSIHELAEMLGRMRQAEKEYEEEIVRTLVMKLEWKIEHAGKSELIGIRESDDLGNMLSSETALLADQGLEQVFYKKFAEKKLLTFDYQSRTLSQTETEATEKRKKGKDTLKGPFIICVDTSGSMHGIPENAAKAICFAILKIALLENRKCFLVSFSTNIQTLDLTGLNNSLEKLTGFLAMSFHGGTDPLPAMKHALQMLETNAYKKADILMISDFIMPSLDNEASALVMKAKEDQNKFHSLVIGRSQNSQLIKQFDHTWFFEPGNKDAILKLVKDVHGTFK